MAVYSVSEEKCVHAMPVESLGLQTVTVDDAHVLCGVSMFEGMDSTIYGQYLRGDLDPRTLKPWGESDSTGRVYSFAKVSGDTGGF
jgi:hypothetical protein